MSKIKNSYVVVLLAILVGAGVALNSYSQVPAAKMSPPLQRVLETMEFNPGDTPADTTVNLYTVPRGKRLVITDVVISNNGQPQFDPRMFGSILRGDRTVMRVAILPGDTFEHTFATGIEFRAGQVLAVRNPASAGPDVRFYLTGYLTSQP